ncbi:hypothetical protein [Winogradskya consettensis]|uniref:hypothetical protein n=1 Tax=Winogradskya consettensis TaxID=113560 RepID=UPI001BB43F63|nr:hypothetical protein [Actinoplanes consettensis]
MVEIPPGYDQSKLASILQWEVSYLLPVTAPLSQNAWVADLRLSMPISKGLLVGRQPIEGFASEDDRLAFIEAVALRKRRPALADVLSEDVPKSLGAYIKQTDKATPEWWQQVEQVRLRIKGDRLKPNAVGLIVCESIQLSPEQRKVWRNWRTLGARILRPHKIKLEPTLFGTLDALPARLYRDSVPIRLTDLGRPPAW